MFNEIIKKVDWCGNMLSLSTGKVARDADGAVLASMGNTSVLCTVVFDKNSRTDIDFFPLCVYYREMSYAAGKIPGGFIKKEGKFSEHEILISRLIDRSIRPLFDSNFCNETQIICTVMSYDPRYSPDILAIIGSSAALAISGIPIIRPIGAARVGLVNDEFVLNPTIHHNSTDHRELDLVVAATTCDYDSITMVEARAYEIKKEQILAAIKFGCESLNPVISAIEEMQSSLRKEKFVVTASPHLSYNDEILAHFNYDIRSALLLSIKKERNQKLQLIQQNVIDYFFQNGAKDEIAVLNIKKALDNVISMIFRNLVLQDKTRIGNRAMDEIRPIICEVGLFNMVHGSALFTRGNTQSLATITLGSSTDEQVVEQLNGCERQHFLLDYIFLPYSVGEISSLRAASRREIGHGYLAKKAIQPVIPTKEEFPYTIRIVSEITQSDGSSSMATVCSASLSLMDAGVPIKTHTAGIAMGGVCGENNNFQILSDICGDEDHFGDIDCKVAGTKNGITAVQLDIKVQGISLSIIENILRQAEIGIDHILGVMNNTINCSKSELSAYAPMVQTLEIQKEKIRDIIGVGGKVIKEICKSFDVEIDVGENGEVKVWGNIGENVKKAVQNIESIVFIPQIGDIFDGEVVKIIESGAFIKYVAGRDGFVHISEINDTHIKDINEHIKLGDKVKVKIIGIDHKNRVKLTLRTDKEHCKNNKNEQQNVTGPIKKRIKLKETAVISNRKYFD
ncbi:polyribonucleotide nucleotidyltransferase [Orientia chuto str. Dubai]|uniref:Polyribonucleotide nucleotidyltransferase n=1 Tax=Orientia chuto str. Dubai TaxID=1359168 RepID=A0A0F3MRH4_9RICK|nr:polyribonucleotide nucleotidyltransferase [Candidatus Orientia mediorientalis]KJV57194.1 polyribonucleotide nucleotidyltransferase [Orientia chuto str. Dubai]